MVELSHLICAIFAIILFGISTASHQKLDIVVVLLQQCINCVQNEMHSLLLGDSAYKGTQGDIVT